MAWRLNQYWLLVNWTFRNKLQWIFCRNPSIFTDENAFDKVVCTMSSMSSSPQIKNSLSGKVSCHYLTTECHRNYMYMSFQRNISYYLVEPLGKMIIISYNATAMQYEGIKSVTELNAPDVLNRPHYPSRHFADNSLNPFSRVESFVLRNLIFHWGLFWIAFSS